MILKTKPQFLTPAYNPMDMILDNEIAFQAILAEFVTRTYNGDTSNGIKRLNIYNDNNIKYDLSEIVKSYIPRLKTSHTFSHNQLSLVDQVVAYLSLIDTESMPTIIQWAYAFNGSLDRNEFLGYDANSLLNKPLLNPKQLFLPTEYGHLNIFNGQYNATDKNTYEYINILNDKVDTNNNTGIYNTGGIDTITSTLTIYDGYLYSWYLATLNDAGTYAIINYSQPDGNNTWRVPDNDDWIELREFLCPAIAGSGLFGGNNNPDNIAGQFLKGDDVWTANAGNNDYLFNAFPTGLRTWLPTTFFYGGNGGTNPNTRAAYISATELDTDNHWVPQLDSANQYLNIFGSNQNNKNWGYSVRLVRDAVPGDLDFNPEGYVGNNGIVYPTVKIGNQVWLATNLVETRWSITAGNNLYKPTVIDWEAAFEKYAVYDIISQDTYCIDDDFFAFPCDNGDPIYGNSNIINIEDTIIVNPVQITNKLYRYINQNYESDSYFPTSTLHLPTGIDRLTSTDNAFNKMITNPIYPASMKNAIGYILNDSVVSVQVNDASRFNVGDIVYFKFEEVSTLSLTKQSILSQSFTISEINGNVIKTTQPITITGYDMENLKCVVFKQNDSLLMEVNRQVIPCVITTAVRTIDGISQLQLVLEFVNLNQNFVTPNCFLQLLSDDQSLLDVFGDLKIKIAGISQVGNTLRLFTTKFVDISFYNWIINNDKNISVIQPNSIVYDEGIDYTNQYNVYTSKWLVNNSLEDDNLYEEQLSDYTEFNLYDECSKFEIVQLGYINQYGAVEYLLFNKKKVDEREISRLTMRKSLTIGNRSKEDEELYNYNQVVDYNGVITSGWLDEDYYNRCLELIESPKVFQVMDGYELPIVIRNTNVIERKLINDKLFSIDIEYTRTYNKLIQR